MLFMFLFGFISVGIAAAGGTRISTVYRTPAGCRYRSCQIAEQVSSFDEIRAIEVFAVCVGLILLYLLWVLRSADKSMLKQSGAVEIKSGQFQELTNMVERIATVAGIPCPKVYVLPNEESPNAFATGSSPKKASVAVTAGLLEMMDDDELEAVLSHEISHIKNFDIRVNTVVFGLTMLMGMIASVLLRVIYFSSSASRSSRDSKSSYALIAMFSVLAAALVAFVLKGLMNLISLAVSRQREYLADASGSELLHNTDSLASALNKLRLNQIPVKQYNTAGAHLFFSDPEVRDTPAVIKKPGLVAKFHNLFSSHPPLELRIARLKGFGDVNQGIIAANATL